MSLRVNILLPILLSLLFLSAAAIAGCAASSGGVQPPTAAPGQPAVLEEFADFACPYCAAFALEALPQLKKDFAEEFEDGRLEYRFRHFPVLGVWSQAAAVGGVCAQQQGKFQRYHDVIFERIGRGENRPDLPGVLLEAGLDPGTAYTCLGNPEAEREARNDVARGEELGVQGTPTLVLNGLLLEWENYYHLKALIRDALPER